DRGRGIVAEQIVYRGSHLDGSLVTVPHHAGQPARVDDARAEDAVRFFAQGPRSHRIGPAGVIQVGRRGCTSQRTHRSNQATVELEVIVAVEQVVFAVVLRLGHYLRLRQAQLES